jgi:hypothetical protein
MKHRLSPHEDSVMAATLCLALGSCEVCGLKVAKCRCFSRLLREEHKPFACDVARDALRRTLCSPRGEALVAWLLGPTARIRSSRGDAAKKEAALAYKQHVEKKLLPTAVAALRQSGLKPSDDAWFDRLAHGVWVLAAREEGYDVSEDERPAGQLDDADREEGAADEA